MYRNIPQSIYCSRLTYLPLCLGYFHRGILNFKASGPVERYTLGTLLVARVRAWREGFFSRKCLSFIFGEWIRSSEAAMGGGGVLGVFMSPKSRKRRLLTNHYVELFWLFCKTYFFRGIPFRFIPFWTSELTLLRKSECLGTSTFFHGITETILSLFRGIFFGTKFRSQPYLVLKGTKRRRFGILSSPLHCRRERNPGLSKFEI